MKKTNVLIVYQFIAEYRKPIFEMLNKSQYIKYSFACDTIGKENIKVVEESFFQDKSFIKLKNYWFKNFLWQKGLIKEVLFGKYDIIIFLADPNFISTWFSLVIGKIKGAKIIFWTHGFIRDKSLKNYIKLFFFRLADGLLLYGNKAKINLISYKFQEKNLFPIFNSLNYLKQKKIRKSINKKLIDKSKMFINPALPQIIFIGRLTKQKKLYQLIYLLIKLEEFNIKVNLLFIGDGSEKSELEKLVNKKNLSSRVYFYGKTYNELEIAPLIMGSDVCISPGEIGLTAMHVLAYGIPIITHDNEFTQMPEYESVIHGVTGRLFSENSFDSMLDETLLFFNNPITNINKNCIEIIENKYNPNSQSILINNAIQNYIKV